jgi:hypothetical protein
LHGQGGPACRAGDQRPRQRGQEAMKQPKLKVIRLLVQLDAHPHNRKQLKSLERAAKEMFVSGDHCVIRTENAQITGLFITRSISEDKKP